MPLSRRLTRFAVVAAIGGLLMNAAAPMLANAAAALAGVPTGEICEVYGVRFPDAPPLAHVHEAGMAMDVAGMPDAASEASSGERSDGGEAATAAVAHADPHRAAGPHRAPGVHAGGHCALTALAAFALPVAPRLAPELPARSLHRASLDAARPAAFDAVSDWASSRKTGPPAAA